MEDLEVLLHQRLGRQRLVQQPLLLRLEPSHFDPVPFGSNLLLLGDLAVDGIDDLPGRLKVPEKKRGPPSGFVPRRQSR